MSRLHSAADESPERRIRPAEPGRARLARRTAWKRLPLEFREVIVLRELEELSYKEISDIARVPVGTVMSRLARGRKRLQQCLAGALR